MNLKIKWNKKTKEVAKDAIRRLIKKHQKVFDSLAQGRTEA